MSQELKPGMRGTLKLTILKLNGPTGHLEVKAMGDRMMMDAKYFTPDPPVVTQSVIERVEALKLGPRDSAMPLTSYGEGRIDGSEVMFNAVMKVLRESPAEKTVSVKEVRDIFERFKDEAFSDGKWDFILICQNFNTWLFQQEGVCK